MTWSGLQRLLLALIALVIVGGTAAASTRSIGQADESVASPQHALRLDASQLTPPAPDAPWQSVELPSVAPHPGAVPQGPAWFRIDFRRESASPRPWAVYLP